jgi:hypothetical protein
MYETSKRKYRKKQDDNVILEGMINDTTFEQNIMNYKIYGLVCRIVTIAFW